MEKRDRTRLALGTYCRVAPLTNERRSSWKRIENISGAGMLMEWCRDDTGPSPRVGDSFKVEIELPAHPTFGQRSLQFRAKVIRVAHGEGGRVMAALQTQHCRFKSPARRPRALRGSASKYVN